MADVLTEEQVRDIEGEWREARGYLRQSEEVMLRSYEALRTERDEWRERAERAEAALREAEGLSRVDPDDESSYCEICFEIYGKPHTDTCPFRVLAGRDPTGESKDG